MKESIEDKKIRVLLNGEPLNIKDVSKPSESYTVHHIPVRLNCYLTELLCKPFDKLQLTENVVNIIGSGFPKHRDKIKIDVREKSGFITITPCNLYTFLQMCGVPVVYDLVRHMEEWDTPDGLYEHKEITNEAGEIEWVNTFTPSQKIATLRKKLYNHHD